MRWSPLTAFSFPQSTIPWFPAQVFGIAGDPVAHDLGYLLHNKFFEASGMDAVYLPLLVLPPHPSNQITIHPLLML